MQQVVCRFLIADRSHPQKRPPGKNSSGADTKLLPALTPGSFVTLRLEVWAKRDSAGKIVHYACRFVDLTPLFLHKEMELQIARR